MSQQMRAETLDFAGDAMAAQQPSRPQSFNPQPSESTMLCIRRRLQMIRARHSPKPIGA